MEIVDITFTDDVHEVARKCNINFRNIAFAFAQRIKRQSRMDAGVTAGMLADAIDGIVHVTVPNEVTSQINALDVPSMVDNAIDSADIPSMVSSEVSSRIPDAYPPVSSYVIMDSDPSTSYPGTTWQQVDSITTTGSVTIPVWKRTA